MRFKPTLLFIILLSLIAFVAQPVLARDRENPRELIFVEVGFSQQITPEQLAVFEKHGGIVDYVFQSVAYGWIGRLPRNQMSVMPKLLGPTFVFIEEGKQVEIHQF